MLIRPATAADASAIASLITHLGYPADAETMRHRFTRVTDHQDSAIFIAEVDGVVAGVASMCVRPTLNRDGLVAELVTLVVAPAHQRLGVGRRLVEAFEAWAATANARTLFLTCAVRREGAHQFYERLGYGRTGYSFSKIR
jgi:GNAT superfamily N-acetyltransferase